MNYNLLEEEWLPVLWKNGRNNRVGIIEALTQAGHIRQIAASNPMDRVAVLRFLLALLYWCRGNPPNKIPDGFFPPHWFKKLYDNRGSFNLLGEENRFYQCKSASGKEAKLSANYLVQEIPTGTNISHFKHSKDDNNGLCRACCALGLLRLPAFATSGGAGKPPGINAKPPFYVIPLGSSLAETLWLSWRQVSSPSLGTPAWEKPDVPLPQKGEVPLLTGLTWLPRRVWLDSPAEPEDRCISCGRKEPLIRQCVFAGLGSAKSTWGDPMVIYDSRNNVLKPGNALGATDAAADQWARIMAGILGYQTASGPSKLWVVGFATVQNDKYLEAREYEIPLPPDYQEEQETIKKLEAWQKEGAHLSRLARPKDPSKRTHAEIPSLVASIRPHVEGRVSTWAGELITGNEEAGQGLDETVDGFDLFTGLWWPLREKSEGAPRREVAWLIAKLYACCPLPQSPGEPLASQLGRCRPNEEQEKERFTQRFDRMLTLPLNKIEPDLRWALDLLAAKALKLDWVKLTNDLSIWEHESMRLQWAQQFLKF